MRRDPSLQSLSRRHHTALQLGRALQAGVSPRLRATLPADPTELVAELRRSWDEEIEPHMRVEEEVLAPAIDGRSAELTRLAAELRAQHAELRAAFARAVAPSEDTVPALDAFGRLLEDHVRWEERTLFGEIQQRLGTAALAELRAPLSAEPVM